MSRSNSTKAPKRPSRAHFVEIGFGFSGHGPASTRPPSLSGPWSRTASGKPSRGMPDPGEARLTAANPLTPETDPVKPG